MTVTKIFGHSMSGSVNVRTINNLITFEVDYVEMELEYLSPFLSNFEENKFYGEFTVRF